MMGKMILFQDFDGVLNSRSFLSNWMDEHGFSDKSCRKFNRLFCGYGKFKGFLQPDLVKKFNDFILKNNIEIVCSSSWRIGKNLDQMKEFYKRRDLPYEHLIGLTPNFYGKYAFYSREDEIMAYMIQNDLKDICAMSVDDMTVRANKQFPKFKPFKTDYDFGITDEIIQSMQEFVDHSRES